ncbi:MAG: hypothetical protein GQ570_10785 [Helicobacteraceae bacterium]|nr:hypothetical protein [Helicobacteraceae bacterium]
MKIWMKLLKVLFVTTLITSSIYADMTKKSYESVITNLESLIKTTPNLKNDIKKVLKLQNNRSYYWNNKDVKYFVNYFKEWLIFNPTPWNGPKYIQPWDALANSEGSEILFNNNIFSSWFIDFLNARGEYLRTTESLSGGVLKNWESFPDVKLDTFKPPYNQSSYDSFEDIFLRVPKKEFNIAGENDERVIVSPASGKIHQIYSKTLDSNFKIKRDVLNIRESLNNSAYSQKFIGGKMVDILLWFTDYHYFHSPVSGEIVDVGEYAGSYNYNFQDVDWYKALAKHKRVSYIIKTKEFGLVAMIPVGFWGVGSIITDKKIKKGYKITKGEKIGRFGYGGSSILLVFEPNAVNFSIEDIDKDWEEVKVGTQIGIATKK